MTDLNVIKKYKTNFLGAVLILKIHSDNTIILENSTFKVEQPYLRILKSKLKKELVVSEQISLILTSTKSGKKHLNSISFLEWHEMRLI